LPGNFDTAKNIFFKELTLNDINDSLLDFYDRYQKVDRYWSNENGTWTLLEKGYTEDWDIKKKYAKIQMFKNVLSKNEGVIFGAFLNNGNGDNSNGNKRLIGFAVLLNKKFGSQKQYVQLTQMHVSNGCRHKGIGKELFRLCVIKTHDFGAQKIYISANDSEDTQRFYLGIGCADAVEIDAESAKAEPCDRQMEFVL